MTIQVNRLGLLLILWAFFVGLIGVGLSWATVLMIIGSVLYLLVPGG